MASTNSEFTVFFSYSREDKPVVSEYYRELVDRDINVWMDKENLRPGEEWDPKIKKIMRSSRLIVFFLSNHSVASDGHFQREIHYATDLEKEKAEGKIFIVPVKLEDCRIPEKLSEFNYINLTDELGFNQLLELVAPNRKDNMSFTGKTFENSNKKNSSKKEIPHITFPHEIQRFVTDSISRFEWNQLSSDVKRNLLTLGCKLEPIVQLIPATPTPLEIGFECLALGTLGECFPEICSLSQFIDPGLLRIVLAIVAVKTISLFRNEATKIGLYGAKNLVFSINLDPIMIESEYFKKFLHWYENDISKNIIFEVNETTTQKYVSQLKNLQVDFDLRFSADDLNAWEADVKSVLLDRVEMTKMDYKSFSEAMKIRGDSKKQAIDQIRKYKIPHKPLIVEGVQDHDYIQFLERNWDFKKLGYLYGQGYSLNSSAHWQNSNIQPLKPFGLPGGSFLLNENENSNNLDAA